MSNPWDKIPRGAVMYGLAPDMGGIPGWPAPAPPIVIPGPQPQTTTPFQVFVPVTREEFQIAMESMRAALREIEAKLDEQSIAKTMRFALDEAERLRTENAKLRRFKGWRVVWFAPATNGGEVERREGHASSREARERVRQLIAFKVASRASVKRVYRKERANDRVE